MRRHVIPKLAAVTLGLSLIGGAALAQDYDRDRHRDRDRDDAAQQQDQNDQGDRRRDRRGSQNQGPQQVPQTAPQQKPPQQYSGERHGDRDQTNDDNNRWRNSGDNDRRDRDRSDNRRDRDWGDNNRRDRNWGDNDRDRRFDRRVDRRDWDRFRRSLTSPQRYRLGSYRAPRGYHYRHWRHGQHLPRHFFVRDYWLTNFVLFGLFAPPPGLIWVRYGPDALLIDQYTGEIIQVRYNVFYT
jgi:Ni/Co efflux regulator RcnB